GNPLPPLVSIDHALVDGKEFDFGDHPDIGPDVDKFEFHYAGMSYVAPEAVRYRYKLEGYDRDWVDALSRRAAYYNNLPPGHYVFHVIACNNDGVWNDVGASLAFNLVPHVWKTGWFRALAALFATAVLAGLYRLRLSHLRGTERQLMREVSSRTEALHAANAELHRLASVDGLTRIANRGAFDKRLLESWEAHRRRGAPLALLLCDIDSFKTYNDTYGHMAGDTVLTIVAAALAGVARSGDDTVARYGGEEFVMLLADCDADQAVIVAQKVLERVRAMDIEHRNSATAPHVTVSVGFAACVPT